MAQGAPSQAYVFDGDSLGVGPDNFGDPQAHEIKVTYVAGDYRATDTAGVVAGLGCNQVNTTTVSCPDTIAGVVPNGGGGNDTLEVESLGPGDETGVHGFRGNDRLIGSPGVDWLVGYAGNDILFGNGGEDRILGGPSQVTPDDDWIDGGPGPDYISGDSSTGGNSLDTVSYQNRPAGEPIRVTLGKGLGTTAAPPTAPATPSSTSRTSSAAPATTSSRATEPSRATTTTRPTSSAAAAEPMS